MSTSLTDRPPWRDFCKEAATLPDPWPAIRTSEVCRQVLGCPTLAASRSRYERIADRLEELFGPLAGFRILEVGGGYGGQAEVVMGRWPVRWSIIDLPEPKLLQRAYLAARGLELTPLRNGGYDLAISNYALSECHEALQVDYARRMRLSPRGYITWNGWLLPAGLSQKALQALIPKSQWTTEPEPAHPRNAVLTWDYT